MPRATFIAPSVAIDEQALTSPDLAVSFWSSSILSYGFGSFLIVPGAGKTNSAKLNAATLTFEAGPSLPLHFAPLTIQGGNLFGDLKSQSAVLSLDGKQEVAGSRPFAPEICGWMRAVSPSGRAVACYKDGRFVSVSTAHPDAGVILATASMPSGITVAVGDDGTLAMEAAQEHTVLTAPSDLFGSIRMTSTSALALLGQEKARHTLSAIVQEGCPGHFEERLVVSQEHTDRALIDIPLNRDVYRIAPRPNTTMIGVMGSRRVLVFDIAHPESPLVTSIGVGDLHTINGAAWDASGEWLLVLGDKNAATLFHFNDKTAAR